MKSEKFLNFSLFAFSYSLLVLFMQLMLAAAATKLFELQPVWRVLFVLRRHVITLLTLGALQNNVVSRHTSSFVLGPLSLVLCK